MKIQSLLFTLALLAGCSAPSGNATPAASDATATNTPPAAPPVATPASASTTAMAMPMSASTPMPMSDTTATPMSSSVASAAGVVKAFDPVAKTITLDHGPVAALHWPAMIMTFKTGDVDVASIKPGDHVAFEFTSNGMDGTLTKIDRQ